MSAFCVAAGKDSTQCTAVIVSWVQKQLTKRGAVHACGAAGCGELADRDDAVAAQEQLRGAPLLPLPAVVGR